MTRTLVRVVEVITVRPYVRVCVPGWDPAQTVLLRQADVPLWLLVDGKRCHASVNLNAETTDDLVFQDWEKD